MMAALTLSGQAPSPHAGLSHSGSHPTLPSQVLRDSLSPPPSQSIPRSAQTAIPHLTSPFWLQTSSLAPLAKPLLLSPVFGSLPGMGRSSAPVRFPPVAPDASSSRPSAYPSLKPRVSLLSLLKLFLLQGVASLIPSHLTTPPPPAHYLYRRAC